MSASTESLESRRLLSAGDLDPSFGVAGRVTTNFGTSAYDNSSAIQSDGKIVVAGSSNNTNGTAFALARYNTNGTLDTSFGDSGTITTAFGASALGNSVAIQSDGKIVVVGRTNDTNSDFALARYNSDGSLDTSFDGDGKVMTDFGTSYGDFANSVAVQTDGKIVVAGNSSGGGQNKFALARYNSDGSLDTSFDGDGKLTADFGLSDARANDVALQPDGKIVVSGSASGHFLTSRFNANGSLDTSFGGSGKLELGSPNAAGAAYRIALQSDGKILTFGGSEIIRCDVSGSLDATFGEEGRVQINFSRSTGSIPGDITIQHDGKILIAGRGEVAGGSTTYTDFAIARLQTNGNLDLTFGSNGMVLTDFGLSTDAANSITLQTDGKVVVAGSANDKFAVARYFANEQPPAFTSASAVDVAENQTNILAVTATDPENHLLTYGIVGGADQAKFAINYFTGALSFVAAPDFENPTDANHNNVYEVQVAVSNGTLLGHQTIAVTVTNINDTNEPPAFSTGATASVAENTTAVVTVVAADPEHAALTYSLNDGADMELFQIVSTTGVLSFKSPPDFENPTDTNHDNVYQVQVRVSDGTNLVQQTIAVTVADTNETPAFTSESTVSVAENATAVMTVIAADPEHAALTYSLNGGPDVGLFQIDSTSGALSFNSPPDFENPDDTNHDNVYRVQVRGSDGTNAIQQMIVVSVTDINEPPVVADLDEPVVIALPSTGGPFISLFLNGQVHLRSSRGAEIITPVTLSSGGTVQFDGSSRGERLTLQSWSSFTGNLTFNGNGGNDQFDARAVSLSVRFNGGDGNDSFLGGSGNDMITGGAGNDSLNGGDGNDVLLGDAGNDKFVGGGGNDVLDGGDGNDNLQGSDGDDSIRGGNGNDKLDGGKGNDVLTGSAGNDSLQGGDGLDWLLGDAGKDALNGGAGIDVINPGSLDTGIDKVSDKTCVLDPSLAFDFDALLATLL